MNIMNNFGNLIRPYQVGAKNSKSLAFILPAKIVKKYDINPSTMFQLKHDEYEIILHQIEIIEKKSPANYSLNPSSQQATSTI